MRGRRVRDRWREGRKFKDDERETERVRERC